ncbi:hypothetical protein [Bombilactobacillus thymidiniphilus]|uniref:Uncharacterized protein n=1 Tax=Bombilactobacillus thymidiniphilus TaxID=2923363 RepID=A0ABY4PBU0_9LACO|nr:hypothetical protein [Bombilactobacillus thymidiniphilus]UQS82986.1 hypothetical protein MOO47_04180 [Bombilactobacillus thymidiniphilus]
MSVLTRVWFGDGKDARLMYDFASKRFMTYKLPESISKLAAVIIVIGSVVAASPYAYSQFIRSSSEYSTRIQPLKYRHDFFKILLFYLVITIVCALLCQFFIEKQVERAGVIDTDVTDMKQVQQYIQSAVNEQRSSIKLVVTMKSKKGTAAFTKEYKKKMIMAWIGAGVMMSCCFILLINEKSLSSLLTFSIMFIFVIALLLYLLIMVLERHIVKKKYNIKY